jgi:hypothetical protein
MASTSLPAFAVIVHPSPEILGLVRLKCGERRHRHLGAVLEEYVAMHVLIVRHRGPFIRTERRELTGLVVLIGDGIVLCPDRPATFG